MGTGSRSRNAGAGSGARAGRAGPARKAARNRRPVESTTVAPPANNRAGAIGARREPTPLAPSP